MKNSIKILMAAATMLGIGLTATNTTTAQAKTRHYKSVKVLKKTATKPRYVKITQKRNGGRLFTDMHLRHIEDNVMDYGGSTGVTTYNVKLRLRSGKVVNYTRVRKLVNGADGYTNGYLRSSYLTTIASPSKKTSNSTTNVTPSKKTPSSTSKTTSQTSDPNVGYHVNIPDGKIEVPYARKAKDVQPESAYTSAKYRDEMIYQINKLREAHGLSPLAESDFLNKVADMRVEQEMSQADAGATVSHYNSKGQLYNQLDAQQILKDEGVAATPQLLAIGENIGMNSIAQAGDDPETTDMGTVNAYDAANDDFIQYVYNDDLSNFGHRKNILSKNYTEIGISSLVKNGTIVNAQDFR